MNNNFPKLFSEYNLKNVKLANRFVFLPHFVALGSDDGRPSERLVYYFVERAKGGVGLIIDGNYNVHPSGMMSPKSITAWKEDVI